MSEETSAAVEATVREIGRKTRKKYSAEDKVWIVLEGLRGEEKIAELCRREGIHQNRYYKWCKEFLLPPKFLIIVITRSSKPVSFF
jgi:transposase